MTVERAKQIAWDDPLRALADDVEFHGPAPIGRCDGRAAVFAEVIDPIRLAIPDARSEPYVFVGGESGGEVWVAATGDVAGTFERPWLGIAPTGRGVRLRFGVFHRFDGERIVETRMLLDVLGLAAQAGVELLPTPPARNVTPPGPAGADGVVRGESDPDQTAFTLRLVDDMLGGCNRLDGSDLPSMGMDAYWHSDMVWHGPHGIGSCYGFDEFQRFAQGPSVASFPNRRGGFHRARFADGVAACFTGWPSLRGDFTGAPFRGIAPTGRPVGQNIMDFYVRRGEKLYENWVLIDLVDFAAQCGVDLLEGLYV